MPIGSTAQRTLQSGRRTGDDASVLRSMVVNDRRKFFVQQPFFRLSKLVLGGGLALQILEAEKDLGQEVAVALEET